MHRSYNSAVCSLTEESLTLVTRVGPKRFSHLFLMTHERFCQMPRLLPVPTIELSLDSCRSLVDLIQHDGLGVRSLACLQRGEVYDRCCAIAMPLAEAVKTHITQALEDPTLSVLTLDVPHGLDPNAGQDAMQAAIIAITLMGVLFDPAIDPVNKTAFTVYNASPDNEARLKKAGLAYFSAEEKLGFHTDGSIDGQGTRVPEMIGLYNLLINYTKPGSLYWVPFSLWEEFDVFAEKLGWDVPYHVELTPSLYAGHGNGREGMVRHLDVPVFKRDENSGAVVFFNGKITGRRPFNGEDIEPIITEMRQSISFNPVRYCIPQRERRLVLARNDRGFHARDMFENPRANCKYTRSFIRAVSKRGPSMAV